jgi:quercetin dioxygenase-like cupin family protein
MIQIILFTDQLKYPHLFAINMKYITLIEKFELSGEVSSEKDIEARQLYKGKRRQIMEIKLHNKAVLSKHKASEPITVLCLAGKGKFRAGVDLQEQIDLEAGTLLTLDAKILHEAIAEPELQLLVTKFMQD